MPKLKKKIFIFVIITLILLVIIGVTFSRYANIGKVNIFANIAPWQIKINGQNVSSASTFTLDDIVWETTDKVANGYAAPGGKGYYEITLDTSGTGVAVDYTIGFNASNLEESTRMKVDKVTFDDVEKTSTDGYYDGFIPLEEVLTNKVITIKVYISWKEESENADFEDVTSVLDYGKIELPMFVMVRQHISDSDDLEVVTQLLPYKETLLQTERPTTGVLINPYYTASLDALYKNPERGMYNSNILVLSKEGNTTKDMQATVSSLLYLKVDLSAFSKWRNGSDIELTQNAIDTLDEQLNIIKQHNNTVILRFVYDNNATDVMEGVKKVEPEQDTLLKHIKSLGEVFQKYKDTIYTIQVGFYGLWGESFYNTDVNDHQEYYAETLKALLEATEGTEITIAFRTPQYAKYAIEHSGVADTSRVGVFNDAYLSQNDDMGTFTNRSDDISWLNSRNTSYGGEALPATFTDINQNANAYQDTYQSVGGIDNYINLLKGKTENWDLIRYTEDEMFKTHTSYINFEWNQNKHYIWSKQIYNGKDTLYQGKTALDYIQSHLGYRLVLRKVEMPRESSSNSEVPINIIIENVGFGNVIKSKKATLIFVNNDSSVKKEIDITESFDIKDFVSTKSTTKNISVNLSELSNGSYKIYLRISNDLLSNGTYYNAIKFANNGIWNNDLQANLVGNIKIK